jgi:hypothetical protein
MPSDFIQQLQCRLVELGCPNAQLKRLSREIAEHREDIKQAAGEAGLSAAEAEARVIARLGDPHYLAEQHMAMLRQSSWLGRHSFIGFGLVPLVAVPVLWGLLLFLNLYMEFFWYGWTREKLHAAGDNPVIFHHVFIEVQCADFTAIALVTLFFCWLARRSAVSLGWMLTPCGICSLYALFSRAHVHPHNFAVGITESPQWIRAAIPLFIAGAICLRRRRKVQLFRERAAV